ncbi:MAG: pilus assembly protein PilM [Deltaproteobacteria bacterium]|nr:pilus assembly protein PilM [Deltaproteobacteria bacterium]
MAQHILGLDIGASRVKGVLLESSYRGFTVVDAAAEPVAPAAAGAEEPLRQRQVQALQRLLAARGWHVETAIAAFPGVAAAQVVTLPFSDPRRIEQTIGFEVEAQIPFDLAEVAWDWQPLSSTAEQSELLVGVVKKEELSGLLADLAGAGIDPRAVVPAGPAYASLWATAAIAPLASAAAPAEPEPPPAEGTPTPAVPAAAPAASAPAPAPAEVLLDLGHARTSFCVVRAGLCEAARTVALGTGEVVRALSRDLGISEADAERLLGAAAAGAAPPAELAALASDPRAEAAVRKGLQPVVRELRATLGAWRSRHASGAPGRLLLAGELAALPGLPELFRGLCDGPVEPLALSAEVTGKLPAPVAPGMALALALALRGHQGSRAPRMNLRRGDMAYTRDFEHVRGKVVRLAVYAGLVLLLAAVSSGVRIFALSRQEALLDRALCDTTQKLVGKCYEDFDVAVSVLKGKGTAAAAVPRVSAVDVFNEISLHQPKEVELRYDRIEITRDKLHLQGTTDAAENVDRIVAALRGSRCFADARSGGARRRGSDQKFEFTVDAELSCDLGAAGGRG